MLKILSFESLVHFKNVYRVYRVCMYVCTTLFNAMYNSLQAHLVYNLKVLPHIFLFCIFFYLYLEICTLAIPQTLRFTACQQQQNAFSVYNNNFSFFLLDTRNFASYFALLYGSHSISHSRYCCEYLLLLLHIRTKFIENAVKYLCVYFRSAVVFQPPYFFRPFSAAAAAFRTAFTTHKSHTQQVTVNCIRHC